MTATDPSREVFFDGVHCTLGLLRPARGIVVAVFRGRDVGEFGDRPFAELREDLATGAPLELFIDARAVPGASVDVSARWASWLRANRDQLRCVSILCGSPFVQLTATFVQRFTGLEERMRIYTNARAFDHAVAAAVADAGTESSQALRTG